MEARAGVVAATVVTSDGLGSCLRDGRVVFKSRDKAFPGRATAKACSAFVTLAEQSSLIHTTLCSLSFSIMHG